ncbi:MAG: hypothetical protein RR956_08560 [Christensenella sp.]
MRTAGVAAVEAGIRARTEDGSGSRKGCGSGNLSGRMVSAPTVSGGLWGGG